MYQIPLTINGLVKIYALADNELCDTFFRKCFTSTDAVIHKCQGNPYSCNIFLYPKETVSHLIGSFENTVRKMYYTMPRAGLRELISIAMIIGRDWQTAVHAAIINEPNVAICINKPSTSQEFGCLKSNKSFISCVIQSRYENKPF